MNRRSLVAPAIVEMPRYQPGRSIDEVRRTAGLEQVIKLASNENPLGPSPKALEAIRRKLHQAPRYPDEEAFELRSELARRLDVEPEEFVLSAGITDLIELVIRTFLTPADHALISAGSFLAYRLFLMAASVPFEETPLRDQAIDLSALAAAVGLRTKLILLPNPNNPTGSRFGPEELERFLAAIPEEVIVFLDDAYRDFQEPGEVPDTIAVLRRRPRTIVARGLSKAYGLAGLRLGYGVCRTELADWLRKVHRPFAVSSLAIEAGRAALDDVEHLERTVTLIRQGRELLSAALAELGFRVLPSHANFVTVDLGGREAAEELATELLGQGLIVRPLAAFGLPGHVRITVGTAAENHALLAALQARRSSSPCALSPPL
jgi:histidinol-phosphate aminotransferase